VSGSAALALSISGCGLVFGGVAAVAAQLAVIGRGARGGAIAALGAALVLRTSAIPVRELYPDCPGFRP